MYRQVPKQPTDIQLARSKPSSECVVRCTEKGREGILGHEAARVTGLAIIGSKEAMRQELALK